MCIISLFLFLFISLYQHYSLPNKKATINELHFTAQWMLLIWANTKYCLCLPQASHHHHFFSTNHQHHHNHHSHNNKYNKLHEIECSWKTLNTIKLIELGIDATNMKVNNLFSSFFFLSKMSEHLKLIYLSLNFDFSYSWQKSFLSNEAQLL